MPREGASANFIGLVKKRSGYGIFSSWKDQYLVVYKGHCALSRVGKEMEFKHFTPLQNISIGRMDSQKFTVKFADRPNAALTLKARHFALPNILELLRLESPGNNFPPLNMRQFQILVETALLNKGFTFTIDAQRIASLKDVPPLEGFPATKRLSEFNRIKKSAMLTMVLRESVDFAKKLAKMAKPQPIASPEPQPIASPEAKPQSNASPEAKPQPIASPEAKSQPIASPEAKPQPIASPEAKPQPIALPEAKPQPIASTEAKPQPIAPSHPRIAPAPEWTENGKGRNKNEPMDMSVENVMQELEEFLKRQGAVSLEGPKEAPFRGRVSLYQPKNNFSAASSGLNEALKRFKPAQKKVRSPIKRHKKVRSPKKRHKKVRSPKKRGKKAAEHPYLTFDGSLVGMKARGVGALEASKKLSQVRKMVFVLPRNC